ncbi:MAG: MFS transporter [Saprospiraceae bacterium]|nr:MFS transporter [Candidatus Defluviibacterium haderslevense]
MEIKNAKRLTIILIVVSALGYFVDVYDLLLFSVVRKKSLLELGVPDADTLALGLRLLNFQTLGLLLGGIFWGMLGDKKGRLTVLFGSIVLYSLANIVNGFVTTVSQYEILRFIAGFGLAGELGAGVTIVMETMKKENRTIGITIVASVGLLGAVVAGYVGQHYDWRTSYIIGGVMGLLLLLLRFGAYESGLYKNIKEQNIDRGNFLKLFTNGERFWKYLKTILVGLPTYFVVGLLLTIAPEFAKEIGIADKVNTGNAMMYCFTGFCIADVFGGLLSQRLQSRKKVFYFFNVLSFISISVFFFFPASNLDGMYIRYAFLGISIGYWALIVTNASEQFGTNLRATVTTTVPNFVRGALVPITIIFESMKGSFGIAMSGAIIGLTTVVIALIATTFTRETYGKDLDYLE